MTVAADVPARWRRLLGGAYQQATVGTSVVQITLNAKTVAFNMANSGSALVRFRTDGNDPTSSVGFPLFASTSTGWVDCKGGLVIEAISGTAGQTVDVWEILDE